MAAHSRKIRAFSTPCRNLNGQFQEKMIGKIKSHKPRTATLDLIDQLDDVLTQAEPSAHRSSSWWCSWNSQHAWHTHDSRHTGDSAARQRRCAHALPGCQGHASPRGAMQARRRQGQAYIGSDCQAWTRNFQPLPAPWPTSLRKARSTVCWARVTTQPP